MVLIFYNGILCIMAGVGNTIMALHLEVIPVAVILAEPHSSYSSSKTVEPGLPTSGLYYRYKLSLQPANF